jgi:cytochrome c oxidase subunit II
VRKKLGLVLGLVALAVVLAACGLSHPTQNSLKPEGPYADKIYDLFVPVFWMGAAVFVLVEGGILWFGIKYRHREGRDRMPPQIHGNTRLEIGWTIVPAILLAVIAVPTVATIWDLARKPPPNAINVTVTGQQWWWKFTYTDPEMKTAGGAQLITADDLVIPTGRTVYLSVTSGFGNIGDAEVIHSFWVPELAGKQDAVPGRTNHILMQADHPGTYLGQCAEFCGLSHANMRVHVTALSPTDYAAWVQNQLADSVTPAPGSQAEAGMNALLGGQCVNCHSISGTAAAGVAGPNLTHFASRDCFAGCLFQNSDPAQIAAWLRDPPALKPGSKMPDYHLSETEIQQLVAYLMSLK